MNVHRLLDTAHPVQPLLFRTKAQSLPNLRKRSQALRTELFMVCASRLRGAGAHILRKQLGSTRTGGNEVV
jgi:hypothetical protein